jgi:PAS domain S-box-containing protein
MSKFHDNNTNNPTQSDSHSTNPHVVSQQPDKEGSSLLDTLEAELNTRMDILNHTAMVTITDLQGTIMYANDLFCSVSGYNRGYIIGHTHDIIRHKDLGEETIASIWKTIRQGNRWQGMMKARRKDGSDLWTKMTAAPVLENGEPVRYVWVHYDISDLKKTEANLYEAKQRADQQLLDNVKDAYRIQRALLPAEAEFQDHFSSSFIVFSPKQSVSGDFYWFRRIADESVIVLGDGTGHGVSASFVSLMALTSLRYAVDDMRVTEPGLVLSHLNAFMYRMMNKHEGSGLSESVDMSFCRFNHTTRVLSYASGRSRLYMVRNGHVEILGHGNSSIGSVPDEECRILTKEITLQPGDRIFIMSDGLADQFGGERNKRLGSRHVKELLTMSSRLTMREQKDVISQNFLHWKGSNEQTDDLSLIAFEIE